MHEEMALYLTLAWFTKLASGSRPGCIIVSVSVSKQTEASVQRVTQHWYMHGTVVVRVPVYAQIRTNSACKIFRKIACLHAATTVLLRTAQYTPSRR